MMRKRCLDAFRAASTTIPPLLCFIPPFLFLVSLLFVSKTPNCFPAVQTTNRSEHGLEKWLHSLHQVGRPCLSFQQWQFIGCHLPSLPVPTLFCSRPAGPPRAQHLDLRLTDLEGEEELARLEWGQLQRRREEASRQLPWWERVAIWQVGLRDCPCCCCCHPCCCWVLLASALRWSYFFGSRNRCFSHGAAVLIVVLVLVLVVLVVLVFVCRRGRSLRYSLSPSPPRGSWCGCGCWSIGPTAPPTKFNTA